MSINVQVSSIPSVNILVSNSGNLLNLSPQGYTLHANTHISGGIDSIDHNYLLGLQGGQNNQYYHLTSGQFTNLNSIISSTGNYTLHSETGAFYASSNPSGFITGVDLSSYATTQYVTGISGSLQGQITNLNNQLVYTTGNQSISGNINISGNLTISGVYDIYQQIENSKILAIAYAIAL